MNVTDACMRARSSAKRAQSFCTTCGQAACAHVMNSLRASEILPASFASCPWLWADKHSSFDGSALATPARPSTMRRASRVLVMLAPVLEALRLEDLLRAFVVVRRRAVRLLVGLVILVLARCRRRARTRM